VRESMFIRALQQRSRFTSRLRLKIPTSINSNTIWQVQIHSWYRTSSKTL